MKKRKVKIIKTGWKRQQKRNQDKQRSENALMIISAIFFVGILFLSGFLFSLARKSVWNGKSRIAWVTQDKDVIKVTTVLPKISKKIIFELPNDLVVRVPFGFGDYRLDKVYALGELEDKGGRLLSRTLLSNLGLAVDGFMVKSKSNFSWWDKARLKWFDVFSKRDTQVIDHQLLSVRKDKLNDGTEVLKISETLADNLVNRVLFDQELANCGVIVSILNASGVSGVAKDVSRVLSNLGMEISLVSNHSNVNQSTQIWVSDESLMDSYALIELKQMFFSAEIKLIDVDEYMSDIVLVVGEDYTQL